MSEYRQTVQNAAEYLKARLSGFSPEIGVALGSGWGAFADRVEDAVRVSYASVPGFPVSTVPGHAGEWVFGRLAGRRVALMSGRFHAYEGHDLKTVTLPVRVMRELGADTAIFTNAAGGVNTGFAVGDLMAITDHLNLTGRSPLTGPNEDAFGPRFPDMSRAYDRGLIALAKARAEAMGLTLREGVYAQMPGPSFETPAEIRMLRALGADAVGMSTVPEVAAARHGGMRVFALSLITNMAAGVLDQPLSHAEVIEAGRKAFFPMSALLEAVVKDA